MTKEIIPHFKNLSLVDIDGEEWRDINGFEGIYQVSNFGRVKSLERKIWKESRGIFQLHRERILRQKVRKESVTEICMVTLQNKETRSSRYFTSVGRLVALTFLNQGPSRYVFHKDLDSTNNHVSNLEFRDDNSKMLFEAKLRDAGSARRTKKFNYFISKYKGVSIQKTYIMQIKSKDNNISLRELFSDEKEAAEKYDFYVKKYQLNRELNFPDCKK